MLNVKETLLRLYEKEYVWCSKKATFNYQGKLQELFHAGLNEMKYDYVDFKQQFCLTQRCTTFLLLPAASRLFLWITAGSQFKISLFFHFFSSASTHWNLAHFHTSVWRYFYKVQG